MATRRYTCEQLLLLRNSPLVEKPENLPAIEQWIDESQQSQQPREQTARRQPRLGAGDASPMGNFSTGTRPSLIQTRSAANRSGEDISLGPPKTVFSSSRAVSRLADFGDKAAGPSNDTTTEDPPEAARSSRFLGDKQMHRKSTGADESEGRHDRESWTQARARRALDGQENDADGGTRSGRYGRRDREKEPNGERRNGYGDKHESRWGPRDEKRPNGERQGGWRERERERKDRDWDKGRGDKGPEWMDDPAPKQEEEDLSTMSKPKNQDDFEKWKQAQHARIKKQTDGEDLESADAPPPPKETIPTKPSESLKLDIVDKPFGGLGDSRVSDSAPTPAKSSNIKGAKTSRFMPMFKKDEPIEEAASPPPDPPPQKPGSGTANGSAEDKEGFQRILQMLGNTTVSQEQVPLEPASPPPRATQHVSQKQKSRFTGFFDQTAKSPERLQSPQSGSQDPFTPMDGVVPQNGRGVHEDTSNMLGARLPDNRPVEQQVKPQPLSTAMSPDQMQPSNGTREQRAAGQFFDQPSRGTGTPENNIQNLISAQRNQKQHGQEANSAFLLDLLQTKNSSRPRSQQARPDGNFNPNQLWMDQTPNLQEPKPRVAPLPPNYSMEDQLLRNHAPPEMQPPPMPGSDMLQRRTPQRAPPGFLEQQDLFMQQQQQHHRRNFTEPPQQLGMPPTGRRMSGHPNLPHMQIPQQQPPFPLEFMQSPGGAPHQAPPPGFGPHMPRHPPGFGSDIPNIFQAPQLRQQQPQRQPPGFEMGGSGVQQTPPPNAPPGFYGGPQSMGGPPGFMQLRSPIDGLPATAVGMRGNGRGFDGFDGMGQRR